MKSNKSGDVYTFAESELGLPAGCLDRFCVGDKVFPESWDHIYGGNVLAVFLAKGQLLIKSNKSGDLYKMNPSGLAVGSGCLEYLCVGQTVYPRSWDHSYGGNIIAINPASRLFTVKSNKSGDVYKFSITDL
ncbi:MAG: hypothetical protein A2X86_09385 [Bdellovibrionales bacterium GWA2_49_15]|nr:MAG: hypothetical protein A2X86_09385 [Bdellovibrionales bacterium GWA2_49_15]